MNSSLHVALSLSFVALAACSHAVPQEEEGASESHLSASGKVCNIEGTNTAPYGPSPDWNVKNWKDFPNILDPNQCGQICADWGGAACQWRKFSNQNPSCLEAVAPDGASDGATSGDASDLADGDTDAHDAAGEPDASGDTSADDAGPNLEPNATFETGTDGWIAFQGMLSVSFTAHGGGKSLRVCTSIAGTTSTFAGDDNLSPGDAIIGASYRARASARTDPAGDMPGPIQLGLRTVNKDVGFVVKDSAVATPVALDATWRQLEVTLAVTERGLLNVTASAGTVPGACFLLDDVVLQRIQ
jgi:hypothetical protein